MKKFFFILLVLTLESTTLWARYRQVPLMPPRESASTTSGTFTTAESNKRFRSERKAVNVELATVGLQSGNDKDFLGMQIHWGIRGNFILPLNNKWSLVPSLGYLLRTENTGSVSLTQNVLEGGVAAQYSLMQSRGSLWHVGVVQRVDYAFSKISVANSSANTPAEFRYRVGPATGFRFVLGSSMDLTVNFEVTTQITKPLRLYGGLSTGLLFFLD